MLFLVQSDRVFRGAGVALDEGDAVFLHQLGVERLADNAADELRDVADDDVFDVAGLVLALDDEAAVGVERALRHELLEDEGLELLGRPLEAPADLGEVLPDDLLRALAADLDRREVDVLLALAADLLAAHLEDAVEELRVSRGARTSS